MLIPKRFLLLLILTLIPLTSCGIGSSEVGRKPSPDWSRGIPLGEDVGGTVGMLVEGASDRIHFAWPTAGDDQAHIHYLQINNQGEITLDQLLDLPPGRQRTPRLLSAGDGQLHLIWALREENSKIWTLWLATLDDAGQLIGSPTPISTPEMNVSDYAVAQSANGTGYVVWEDRVSAGLYGARIPASGAPEDPVLIVEMGESPGITVDEAGDLHLVWFDGQRIAYELLPQGQLAEVQGSTLVILEEITAALDGPIVATAGDLVYVIWSIFARTGLEANTGWTEYVTFTQGDTNNLVPTRLWMLTDEEQPYESYAGAYQISVLAPPVNTPALSSDYIVEPGAAGHQGAELALVVSTKQEYRLQELVQLAIALFEDGEFRGYEIATKTESFSQDGILATDTDGNLHLSWLEGTGRRMYFASTSPGIKAGLDRLGGGDLASAFLGGSLEAATGILFFPLSLIWFVPGAIILAIYKLRKDDETVNDTLSKIMITVAVLAYFGTKFLFLPTFLSYVPFSAWIDVPGSLSLMLRIVVPLSFITISLIVAELVRRRRPYMTSIIYYFLLCGVDALLTLAVYGVNFLGVY